MIEKLRRAGPVVEVRFPIVGRVWTTTTQDLADRVLKDSNTFTLRQDDGSGSVYELLKDRGLRDWLAEDWTRTNLVVEEFLRFISPVQFTKPRLVREDVELGGIGLKKGEKIMPMLAAANLDPQANANPEKLDLERRPNRHIAFGTGIHFCLGHELARIEAVRALKALFRRWPKLELVVPESQIRWRKRPGLSAIEHVPVATWD
jgi:cytochrome P450